MTAAKQNSETAVPDCDSANDQMVNEVLHETSFAYISCRLVVPSGIITVLSIVTMLSGFLLGHWHSVRNQQSGLINKWLYADGWHLRHCANFSTNSIPTLYLPSLLRLLELTVEANVLFRVGTCIPNVLRVLQSYLLASRNGQSNRKAGPWYHTCNKLAPVVLVFEVASCTVFSINTIRQDYPVIYRISFILFIWTALLHMIVRVASLIFRKKQETKMIDCLSHSVKLICMTVFGSTAPLLLVKHLGFIDNPTCHYYVSAYDAIIEYLLIISNCVFHLTTVIDIRDIDFVLYPRTCSGELEPLKPENFKIGGKHEYCRSNKYVRRKQLDIQMMDQKI